jgi:CAAX prenyl protease-like protein
MRALAAEAAALARRRADSLARITPFALYLAFLAAQPLIRDVLPTGWDGRWLYAVQIGAVLAALSFFARHYAELRPLALGAREAIEAVGVGVVVFALWINLDFSWAMLGAPGPGFDPRNASGDIDPVLAAVRIFGAAAVVPIMEELFWRSYILRWIDETRFLSLAPAATSGRALLISAVLFGFEHNLWLAGIVAGLAYCFLYRRAGKLWSPILAHATTNLLLGGWVLATGAWSFW